MHRHCKNVELGRVIFGEQETEWNTVFYYPQNPCSILFLPITYVLCAYNSGSQVVYNYSIFLNLME